MPLPDNVQTGTVIGRFISLKDGTPMQGTVTFAPTLIKALDATADDPGPVTLIPEAVKVTLDENGAFTRALTATDDPQLNPHDNWNYKVTHDFGYDVEVPSFYIDVPQDTTIDLTLVSPAEQGGGALLVVGIPTGGADGQILAKASTADYHTEWINPPTGGGTGLPSGGTTGQALIKNSGTDGDATWQTLDPGDITGLSEAIDDRVAALLVAGTNVSLAYNDAAGTLTINATGGGGGGSVAWADITGKPAAIAAGVDAAAARAAIGAGTSNLAIGTTGTTAKAGDYAPDWGDVGSKPAVIAAGADAVTARSAIGAGTSNLALGTTGSTAMAGNKTAADLGGLASDPTGITGATALGNIVKISETDYAALPTKDPDTLYVRTAG